ncbi:MAG: single-stranded-DNA-specific exonuclease RecJ [Alphaproteobacteria bacterium]|nr:single-stranded-DNA-specific exonuclease RecJ [Alphaproteobacteria bacterium]
MLDVEDNIAEKLSVSGRTWQLREAELRQVMAISQQHGLSQNLAQLLVVRGVALEDVEDFLNPSLKNSLPDPSHLLDMDKAVARIAQAINARETIAIWGDYDVDGATSSALLRRYFRALGMEPLVHIPDRMKEGYGLNAPGLLALRARGAALAISVDSGTLSFEPIEKAVEAGLDVIVVDHHLGEAKRPKACALVNPNRLDETSPHRHLAAVGVAFLLLVALNKKLREEGFFTDIKEPDLRQWLDIVALGTICDVVPLVGVNRALVAQGLKVMGGRGNVGMRAVMDAAGLDERPGVYHAGYVIGPRINAGGRVGKSDLGVHLLSTEDPAEAVRIAHELNQYNAERKAIESLIQQEADALADAMDDSFPIMVVAGKGWHSGVIGIVAGRLKERFRKPVAVIGIEGGIGKASARSVSGMDFGAAVIAAKEEGLLLAGGGHAMAAGFTVAEEKIPALTEFLCTRLSSQVHHLAREHIMPVDLALSIGGATPETAMEIEKMGPFGQGNFSVRVMLQSVVNLRPERVGEHHVKTLLTHRSSNAKLSAIAFRCAENPLGQAILNSRGQEIDVVGQLRLQEWQGRPQMSLMIEDIRLGGQ